MVASSSLSLNTPSPNTLLDVDILRDGRMVVAYHRARELAFTFKTDFGLDDGGTHELTGINADLDFAPQIIALSDGGFAALQKLSDGSFQLFRYSLRGDESFGYPVTVASGTSEEALALSEGANGSLLVTFMDYDGSTKKDLSIVEYSIFGAQVGSYEMDERPGIAAVTYSNAAVLNDGRMALISFVPGDGGETAQVRYSDEELFEITSIIPGDVSETVVQMITTSEGYTIAIVGFVHNAKLKFWAVNLDAPSDNGPVVHDIIDQGVNAVDLSAEAVATEDGGFKLLVRSGEPATEMVFTINSDLKTIGAPVALAGGPGDLMTVAAVPGNGVVWVNENSNQTPQITLQGVGTELDDIEQLGSASHYDAGEGNDLVYGSQEDDTIFGGAGVDTIFGGAGNDRITTDDGTPRALALNNVANGGSGNDIIKAIAVSADISGGRGRDVITGSNQADTIKGNADPDLLRGKQGNDWISGGQGNDLISGGLGHDTILGGTNHDLLRGEGGDDLISGELGRDRITGGAGFDTLEGGLGNDTIIGGADDDLLSGGAGKDTFVFKDLRLPPSEEEETSDDDTSDTTTASDDADDFVTEVEILDSDIITDFSTGDIIEIRSHIVTGFADLEIETAAGGNITYVRFGHQEIMILSDLEEFTAADFGFVML